MAMKKTIKLKSLAATAVLVAKENHYFQQICILYGINFSMFTLRCNMPLLQILSSFLHCMVRAHLSNAW